MTSRDDEMIRSNDLVTAENAPAILREQSWFQGNDGSIYIKTNCQCHEHPHIADITNALEKLRIYEWSSSKDRDNHLTIMVRGEDVAKLAALGITPSQIDVSGRSGASMGIGV